MIHTEIPPAPKPTEQQIAMCKQYCGSMGNTGFHSALCPLSGVDHPSRPGNTFRPETLEQEKERVLGTCGGKCGEAPCVEWNKANGKLLSANPLPGSINNPTPEERERIGNTPTCEDCGKATGNCMCDADAIDWTQESEGRDAVQEAAIPEHVLPPINEFIDITPKGLKTPESIKRVNEAMAEIDRTTTNVANLATEMVDRLANNRQWFCSENDRLKAAIQARQNAQYNLVAALSDKPNR